MLCSIKTFEEDKMNSSIEDVISDKSVSVESNLRLTDEQKQISDKIEQYGRANRYPEVVIISTLDAAITESNLNNLSYGDRDSIGVFQMRESQGWGSREQILNPDYSIPLIMSKIYRQFMLDNLFFTEHPYLLVQTVEKSAYPEKYKQNFQRATDIHILLNKYNKSHEEDYSFATKAQLAVKGMVDSLKLDFDYTISKITSSISSVICSVFTKPNNTNNNLTEDSFVQSYSAARAIKQGLYLYSSKNSGWHNRCLAFVEQIYDVKKRYGTALGLYRAMDRRSLHSQNITPVPGALLFFSTNNPAGHIAVALNQSTAITTDIPVKDHIGLISISLFQEIYKFHYLGWADPVFP